MARDPEIATHKEWIGYVQPVGLVVSPPALVAAQAFPSKNIIPEHTRFLDLAEEVAVEGEDDPQPAIRDFPRFATQILGWEPADLLGRPDGEPVPDSLEVTLSEYNETLRPTYAVPEFEKDATGGRKWLMLIQRVKLGLDLDETPETDAKDHRWQASPQARFERLLRETQVPIGLLSNGTHLRLVYAPRGETSGHATFRVPDMTEVAGRSIFAALRMLLSAERLFTLPDKQRLPNILAESRKYQNLVSTKLAEQVLAALYELVRGFQAADDQRNGDLLRDVLKDDPNQVYGGLLRVLLRLVFILFAEDRSLLSNDEVYQKYYSVLGLFERLREDAGRHTDTMDHRFGAWAQLLTLFRLIYDGGRHGGLKLLPRKGYLFDPDRYPFLEGRGSGDLGVGDRGMETGGATRPQPPDPANPHSQILPDPPSPKSPLPRVSDGVVFRVLRNLLILDGERLSYRTLDVEQIGSVYETMMGFNLEVARGRSIAIKPKKSHGAPTTINLEELLAAKPADRAKWLKEQTDQAVTGQAAAALKDAKTPEDAAAALEKKLAREATPNIVPPGAMVLQPSDERRKSGSHYTPRSLTEPIVRTTLRPILERLGVGSGELGGRERGEQRHVGEDPFVSRPESLATRDGSRRIELRGDEALPARGDLRAHQPDPPVGGGNPGEHRGGSRAGHSEGVSAIPAHGPGEPSGTGDASPPEHSRRSDAGDDIGQPPQSGGSTREDVEHAATTPHPTPQILTPNSLAIRGGVGSGELGGGDVPVQAPTTQILTPKSFPTPEQILELKVCDPAMGSGAFLVEACRQLAESLVKAWHAHDRVPPIPPDEDEILHARRIVAQRCLYGVDKNPMAVDLAKLSLWLATLAKDHPFTFLDHALRCGDSLVGLSRDQITAFHWDASSPKKYLRAQIQERLRRANDERRKIREAGDDVPDALLRQKLDLAEESLNPLRLYGDAIVGAFFARPNDKARKAYLAELAESLTAYLVNPHKLDLRVLIEAAARGIALGDHPVTPFHWEIEFPEVFDREKPGFDAFVGNPPFAGKNTLTGGNREGYLDWLKATHEESHGNADLVAHFFRRAFDLAREGGTFGLIATNTIGQGDTRSTGLRWICKHGGTIYEATRRKKWPGLAAVVISVVHAHKGSMSGPFLIDGRPAPIITAYLFHAGGHDDPAKLSTNEGKSFQGSIILGMGFTFDDTDTKGIASPISEMERLIASDRKNSERIFPFMGWNEVTESPAHKYHRYAINFGEMTELEARRWPDLMRIVEEKVKPKRLEDNRNSYRRYWSALSGTCFTLCGQTHQAFGHGLNLPFRDAGLENRTNLLAQQLTPPGPPLVRVARAARRGVPG